MWRQGRRWQAVYALVRSLSSAPAQLSFPVSVSASQLLLALALLSYRISAPISSLSEFPPNPCQPSTGAEQVDHGRTILKLLCRELLVAAPTLNGNEKRYVLECLETTWISSIGRFITEFESAFARFCGVEHAIAVSNGTNALHLALVALGLKPGDEVIVPTLTYIATANAVTYCGAKPVLVDCDPGRSTWIRQVLLGRSRRSTKGIIPVHLYGHPTDMDPIVSLAREHGLFVLEDAAEAHGAEYKGRRVGGLGNCAAFSFFGNKIMTTGEGGMVTTNDGDLAAKLRLYRGQGLGSRPRYWHSGDRLQLPYDQYRRCARSGST